MKTTFLTALLHKSRESRASLFLLNRLLYRLIPFNAPHKLSISQLSENSITVAIPFIRKNKNHLGGIHACCMATAAEFASGLGLMSRIDSARYRLILSSMQLDYSYQAGRPAYAKFELHDELFEEIGQAEKVLINCMIPVYDDAENLLCEANVCWQVKAWKDVRTS